jgi:hypothetical protein
MTGRSSSRVALVRLLFTTGLHLAALVLAASIFDQVAASATSANAGLALR